MKIYKILIILSFTLSINNTFGQSINCMREINDAVRDVRDCMSRVHPPSCNHRDLMEKADEFIVNPTYLNCVDYVPYVLKLSDFYYYTFLISKASEEKLSALNNSIKFVEKAGKIDSSILNSREEGAERLAERYEFLSRIYFDLKEQEPYDAALEKAEYWSDIYSGKKERQELLKRIAEEEEERKKEKEKEAIKKREAAMRDTSITPKRTYVRPYSHRYIIKPIVVYAMVHDTLRNLTDDKLEIVSDPDAELFPSEKPDHYRYAISVNERTDYKITISYPGFEDQYFQYEWSLVNTFDSIRVYMFPSGTPYFRTYASKRPFEPDSSCILIRSNPKYFPKEKFDSLINSLDLKRDENDPSKFKKISGEPFDSKNDSILRVLRQKPHQIVQVAGHNLGTPQQIAILTNKLQIIWKKKPEERSAEEELQMKKILDKYQLTLIREGVFENIYAAPLGIGFHINIVVEELNQLPSIRLAFPEPRRPIIYH